MQWLLQHTLEAEGASRPTGGAYVDGGWRSGGHILRELQAAQAGQPTQELSPLREAVEQQLWRCRFPPPRPPA